MTLVANAFRVVGLCASCAMLPFASSRIASAEALFRLDAGALYDNNLSRATNADDIRADGAATIAGSAGWFLAPTEADTLTLGINVLGQAYTRYHGLDTGSIGISALYGHKFGLGYAAPWVTARIAATNATFGSSIRNGPRVIVSATAGKRFDEFFDAALEVFYDRRYARNDEPVVPGISGAVFDLRVQGVLLSASYAITDRLQLGANAGVRGGDVVSTTQRSPQIFTASSAIAEDFTTFGDGMYAYRMSGTTRSLGVSVSYALDDHSSLNASFGGEHTSASEGLDYKSQLTAVSFAYRY